MSAFAEIADDAKALGAPDRRDRSGSTALCCATASGNGGAISHSDRCRERLCLVAWVGVLARRGDAASTCMPAKSTFLSRKATAAGSSLYRRPLSLAETESSNTPRGPGLPNQDGSSIQCWRRCSWPPRLRPRPAVRGERAAAGTIATARRDTLLLGSTVKLLPDNPRLSIPNPFGISDRDRTPPFWLRCSGREAANQKERGEES